ncbi:hypothetical protein HUW46_02264 [Amycolatopsis sp. CA-230715]|nr:hypothetical protein HUW46_02264 [Amycolatopsis sp. CA-230715]
MRSLGTKTVATLFLVATAALLAAPAADAHSVLVSSTPAKNASIATAPAQVSLEFNEPLEHGFTQLAVTGPDGASHWEGGQPVVSGPKVTAPLRPLGPAGAYTVRYRVVSADGHPVSGTIGFTLTAAGPANAVPAAAAEPPRPAPPSDSIPVWPWVFGAVILLVTGITVARRIGRAPAERSSVD